MVLYIEIKLKLCGLTLELKSIKYSIIIVNYNSLNDIRNCVHSIITKTTTKDFEIIVVSNSTETKKDIQTIEILHPHLKYIQLDNNYGFSIANNVGAKNSVGQFLFFLNPDTIFINDVLNSLFDFLDQRKEIILAGPAIFNEHLELSPSIANIPSFMTLTCLAFPVLQFLVTKKYRIGNYIVKKDSEVPMVQGSSMFIRKNDFFELHMFDEDYFLYSEETDLCYRISKSNKKVGISLSSKLIHVGGTSTSHNFDKLEIVKHQSRKLFLKKHKPHLLFYNRFAGILGYFSRYLIMTLLLKNQKAKYFANLAKWYFYKYK